MHLFVANNDKIPSVNKGNYVNTAALFVCDNDEMFASIVIVSHLTNIRLVVNQFFWGMKKFFYLMSKDCE